MGLSSFTVEALPGDGMSAIIELARRGELIGIDGIPLDADWLEGKVLMFVNVASHCMFTKQYEGLILLQRVLQNHGFSVIGVPCNQFEDLEPGTPEQIRSF